MNLPALIDSVCKNHAPPCTCGTSLSHISVDGKLGCPACYTHFRHFISAAVTALHGSSSHQGKSPGGLLRKAIADERYEDAAKIAEEKAQDLRR